MASFQVVNRSPDGSSYFSQFALNNWVATPIVEMVSRGFNGTFVEMDYVTMQMSAVAGFPPLYFRVYGHFTFENRYNSDGVLVPHVAAGSIINSIEVINATGYVYDRIDGINFAFNSPKTTISNEPINVFVNSFRPGEVPLNEVMFAGNDVLTGNSGTEVLDGFAGNDSLAGLGGSDALYGNTGDDTLNGGEGADDLYGGAGNDVIVGYTAGDYIDGGADFDTWALTGTYSTGISLPVPVFYTGVNLLNIEAIRITWGQIVLNSNQVGGSGPVQTIIAGSSNRDALRVDMAAGAHVMNLSGVNFVGWNNWSGEFDLIALNGSAGNDTIDGSTMDDQIWGNGGQDILRGGAGSDVITAAEGNDILRGGDWGDRLTGWGGNDTLVGDDDYALRPDARYGDDSLYGGVGDDAMTAAGGFNLMDGGAGNDWVDYRFVAQNPSDPTQFPVFVSVDLSRAVNPSDPNSAFSAYVTLDLTEVSMAVARDFLLNIENVHGSNYTDGIIGNDLANSLNGWAGADEIFGRGGDDRINGGSGIDSLSGEAGNDIVLGGTYGDLIYGGAGDDALRGDGGADQLFGDAGADKLRGGLGADQLTGGAGADRFIFDTAIGRDVDRVNDFVVGEDRLYLENAVFTGLANGRLAAGQFKNLALGVEDANDRVLWNPANGALYFDADGAGGQAPVRFALVHSSVPLTAAAFMVF